MAKFALIVDTDDHGNPEADGPYTEDSFQAALEAAFGNDGLEVAEIREVPEGQDAHITVS